MSDVPDFLRESSVSEDVAIPDETKMKTAQRMATELVILDGKISEMEEKLSELTKRRNEIMSRNLPDYFDSIGIDSIGVMGIADVKVSAYYHANIQSDWDADRRERSFQYLESLGAGDLISGSIVVKFGRGDIEDARGLMDMIRSSKFGNKMSQSISIGVPWNTLTSFLKERVLKGESTDLDMIGGKVGRRAKIVRRK